MDKKSSLRQELIKKRTAITKEDKQSRSHSTCQQLLDQINWASVTRVHIYHSRDDWGEVGTSEITNCLEKLYPDVFIDVASQHRDEPAVSDHDYDVIIVPVLGYDKKNNRIGMGMGWYDRFLATQPAALKIGLAYSESEVDEIPVEDHDVALDQIIAV